VTAGRGVPIRRRRIVAATVAAVALLGLWSLRDRGRNASEERRPEAEVGRSLPADGPIDRPAADVPADRGPASAWTETVSGAREAAAGGEAEVQAFVYALQAGLDRLPHAERVASVRAFLASGADVAFGDRFRLGPGGYLVLWPSLRVALFDYLAQRDGASAREVATEFLAAVPEEPGEWTLAFRELARGRSHAEWDAPLSARVREFLAREDWIHGARRAWLEGFDVVVAGRATPLLAELAALTARPGPAAFAAFLAADRLMMADERAVLASLEAAPALFETSTRVRAGLYARADPRDPVQVERVAKYLRQAGLGAEEAAHFGELFPFHGAAEGATLLSRPGARSMAEMVARDRAAVEVLARWAEDASMIRWRPLLVDARRRVERGLAPVAGGSGGAK
jgi:hypothetical protein